MFISKKTIRPRTKKIVADTEMDVDVDVEEKVSVDPEASELLFEAEDVAELVAEVTGKPVEVSAEDDTVVFSVDGDEFKVEPDGDEEIVESSTRFACRSKSVNASTSLQKKGRMVRRIKK